MSERRLTAVAAAVAGASMPAALVLQIVAAARGLAQAGGDAAAVAQFASENRILSALFPASAIVMSVAALTVIVGLHPALSSTSRLLATTGAALGLFWVFCDLLQALLRYLPFSGVVATEFAEGVTLLAQAVWHASRVGAGFWIVSVAATGRDALGPGLRFFSLAVGLILVGHPFLVSRMPAWIELQMVGLCAWFVWTAVSLLRHHAPPEGHGGHGALQEEGP